MFNLKILFCFFVMLIPQNQLNAIVELNLADDNILTENFDIIRETKIIKKYLFTEYISLVDQTLKDQFSENPNICEFFNRQMQELREYYRDSPRKIMKLSKRYEQTRNNFNLRRAIEDWQNESHSQFPINLNGTQFVACPIVPIRMNGKSEWWNIIPLPQEKVNEIYKWFLLKKYSPPKESLEEKVRHFIEVYEQTNSDDVKESMKFNLNLFLIFDTESDLTNDQLNEIESARRIILDWSIGNGIELQ